MNSLNFDLVLVNVIVIDIFDLITTPQIPPIHECALLSGYTEAVKSEGKI